MSVAGYIGNKQTELQMKTGRQSDLGIIFHGPVLRGDKTVEEGRRQDVITALRLQNDRVGEPCRSISEYDAVLRGHCRGWPEK